MNGPRTSEPAHGNVQNGVPLRGHSRTPASKQPNSSIYPYKDVCAERFETTLKSPSAALSSSAVEMCFGVTFPEFRKHSANFRNNPLRGYYIRSRARDDAYRRDSKSAVSAWGAELLDSRLHKTCKGDCANQAERIGTCDRDMRQDKGIP
jgi:hypothetical protein